MALPQALSIKTTFNIADTIAKIKIQEITDFVLEGISLSDVKVNFQISSPLGVFYNNTNFNVPDIHANRSRIFADVALPLDVNSKVIQGTYTVISTYQISGGVQAGTYSTTNQYNYCENTTAAKIEVDIDCLCSSLKSKDLTAYGDLGTGLNIPILNIPTTNTIVFNGDESGLFVVGKSLTLQNSSLVNNGIYPITNSVYGDISAIIINTQILSNEAIITTSVNHQYIAGMKATVAGVLINPTLFNGTFEITSVTANTFRYALVNPDIASTADTGTVKVKATTVSITGTLNVGVDTGNIIYQNFIRTHEVHYPAALHKPTIVSSLATIIVTPIYTNTWTSDISTIFTTTGGDGLNLVVKLTGDIEYAPNCDFDMCDILCCIYKLKEKYVKALTVNPTYAAKIKLEQLDVAIYDMVLFRSAQECGKTAEASKLLDDIMYFAECTKGCGCSGDSSTPQKIVAVCSGGGSGTTVVETSNNGIEVVPSTDGDVTTYLLNLNMATIQAALGIYPLNLVNGSGINIVHNGIISGKDQWTINSTATADQNRSEFIAAIDYTNADTLNIPVVSQVLSSGNMLTGTPAVASIGGYGGATWLNSNNRFRISGFKATGLNTNFKITGSVINSEYLQSLGYNGKLELSFVDKAAGQIDFILLYNGQVVSNAFFVKLVLEAQAVLPTPLASIIELNIKISE